MTLLCSDYIYGGIRYNHLGRGLWRAEGSTLWDPCRRRAFSFLRIDDSSPPQLPRYRSSASILKLARATSNQLRRLNNAMQYNTIWVPGNESSNNITYIYNLFIISCEHYFPFTLHQALENLNYIGLRPYLGAQASFKMDLKREITG